MIKPAIYGIAAAWLLHGCAPAYGQVSLRWMVDPVRPAPAVWPVFQGETVYLEPTFSAYGRTLPLTNATASLYYQTNGMDAAWWSVPAAIVTGATPHVRATWLPAYDCGAKQYTYFIALQEAATTGISYRAYGTLTMRHSPGILPAILPPPSTLSDIFAAFSNMFANAGGTVQCDSNALATVFLPITWPATGTVAVAEFAATAAHATSADWAAESTHASEANNAFALFPGAPDGLALAAAQAHPSSASAHADIRQAIAGATNAIVQTYFLTTNAYMTVSNATLTIFRVITNTPAAVWSSAESEGGSSGVDPSFTNALWSALAAKADQAWGQYAPDGSANPDPAFMTFLNAPATMHASGYAWSTYGTYAVLAQSGAVAFDSGSNGEARWGLDLFTNYVGFVRGGSVTVGARAGSIHVADEVATIVFPYTSGEFPEVWFAPALDVPFALQEGVVWVDNTDGSATVSAPATTPKGFWYATTSAQYNSVFETRPPLRAVGGVIGATNDLPIVYNATITISSDGKNYRLPAQLVP